MEEGVARVMVGKQILLMGALLRQVGYQDKNLVRDLAVGFPVVGRMSESFEFPARARPAQVSSQALFRLSRWAQQAASGIKAGMEGELLGAVWEKTLEEADPGK
eukprot:3742728-Alexandrium_andersonii.AAC.1